MSLSVGSALAQSTPTERGYDESLGVIGEIQSEDPQPPQRESTPPAPTPPPPAERQQESDLPFTGLDLGIVALMGVLLLGTGIVLRRTTRTRGSTL